MSNLPELGGLITEMRAELIASTTSVRDKTTDSAFADTLARCATPLFSPWPLATPLRSDTAPNTDQTLSARPADQRRDRRQRSRG